MIHPEDLEDGKLPNDTNEALDSTNIIIWHAGKDKYRSIIVIKPDSTTVGDYLFGERFSKSPILNMELAMTLYPHLETAILMFIIVVNIGFHSALYGYYVIPFCAFYLFYLSSAFTLIFVLRIEIMRHLLRNFEVYFLMFQSAIAYFSLGDCFGGDIRLMLCYIMIPLTWFTIFMDSFPRHVRRAFARLGVIIVPHYIVHLLSLHYSLYEIRPRIVYFYLVGHISFQSMGTSAYLTLTMFMCKNLYALWNTGGAYTQVRFRAKAEEDTKDFKLF